MASLLTAGMACFCQAENEPLSSEKDSTSVHPPPLALSADRSFWNEGIGSGFRKGAHEVGLSGAYATGIKIFGTSQIHNLAFATIHGGWIVSDVVMKDSPLRGNWEVLVEGFSGVQINHSHAYLAGIDGFIRYNIATGTRFVPFMEIGAGLMATDIGKPDLGGDFQFGEKAGIGAHYFFTENIAATLECRLMHISNAGLSKPNLGVNSVPILLGISYFF